MPQGMTKLSTQVVPEVLAPMMQAELDKKLRFASFAEVDNTLKGQPGDTLTFPAFVYSGDAQVVAEGEKIPTDILETKKREAKIRKVAKGTSITDEALLSGYGDPQGEQVRQHGLAHANKVDNDVLEALMGAKLTVEADITKLDGLQSAIDKFNDEDLEPMVLFVNPLDAGKLRGDAAANFTRATELGDNIIVKGAFGEALGAVIVRSNKLEQGTAILAKKGAVKLITKREFFLETDRDPSTKTTALYSDKHYLAYLYDESKAVKITKGQVDSGDEEVL
ncbi:N4-gp56 family major capsid protein [Staphylococcus pseudintermedius]|uniref:N4-gp56 family major capsid protein n=1 Tax=Staphylococcus pseudintermedius TaxID=283734 RepID=UPI000C1C08F2|nr:N4-gp56 family major capsid protein [Staphylococcus pseudintermedius]EGQ0329823.1 N4-gp56 family major capsid protein [Staphylococcus pseudintermedius]EGQ1653365.1 N4-gp56 family major capsid protein [Staphylococcus pseudintermedius]EGQ3295234.1 N4-gp56 family major capsid protein [Staphylococcus pseudintermedius]EGQ4302600.1 N4-gp56 family major capsid protein [Staphylococcus pseudintermedius]EGQ4418309.1 N4-gp56 family major capsid protein [Staphylococcus pseudintermedius]